MNSYNNPYYSFSGVTAEEMGFLNQATSELNDEQKNRFISIYSSKRKNPQDILLISLLGFFGFAGIHRFMLGQIGMGLLYFLTGGLCVIGTIVDIINHKSLTTEYNKQMAYESFQIAKMYN